MHEPRVADVARREETARSACAVRRGTMQHDIEFRLKPITADGSARKARELLDAGAKGR